MSSLEHSNSLWVTMEHQSNSDKRQVDGQTDADWLVVVAGQSLGCSCLSHSTWNEKARLGAFEPQRVPLFAWHKSSQGHMVTGRHRLANGEREEGGRGYKSSGRTTERKSVREREVEGGERKQERRKRKRRTRSLHSKLWLGSGSSSSLTDLSQAKSPGAGGVGEKGGTAGGLAEECSRDKGTQQRRAGANATWNSIHNAVISVFQRKDLGENELYTLNEGVRQLLKTELGSFFTEYLQNQLLTKGMVILRDKIRFYEEKRLQRSWPSKPGNSPVAKNLVVRSKSYNVPMLTPVVEYDMDSSMGGNAGIRRHSVCEMTSCVEETSSVAESTASAANNTNTSSLASHSPASTASDTVASSQDLQPRDSDSPAGLQLQHHSPCIVPEPSPSEDTHCTGSLVFDSGVLAPDMSSGPSLSSSPEMMMDHILESLDSEPEHDGIFLDFTSRDSDRQSVA
ncbi:hypothetical protein PAMP_015033 [Pampus punctatissimus]